MYFGLLLFCLTLASCMTHIQGYLCASFDIYVNICVIKDILNIDDATQMHKIINDIDILTYAKYMHVYTAYVSHGKYI